MGNNIREIHYYENNEGEIIQLDSIVSSIIDQFTQRSIKGKEKYGFDLNRTDLSLLEWIEHAKQDHMDAILYLEKIKQMFIDEQERKIY